MRKLIKNDQQILECLDTLALSRQTKELFCKELVTYVSPEFIDKLAEWASKEKPPLEENQAFFAATWMFESYSLFSLSQKIYDISDLIKTFNYLMDTVKADDKYLISLLNQKKALLADDNHLLAFLSHTSKENWLILSPLNLLNISDNFDKAIRIFDAMPPKDWYLLTLVLKMGLVHLNLNTVDKISEFIIEFSGRLQTLKVEEIFYFNQVIHVMVGEDKEAMYKALNILKEAYKDGSPDQINALMSLKGFLNLHLGILSGRHLKHLGL